MAMKTNRICTIELVTILSHLPVEKLYINSDFEKHQKSGTQCIGWTHKDNFIFNIVFEFMKQKSSTIGNRITEEEKGAYIRHNYKKMVHSKDQKNGHSKLN